ncbi:MAG: ABC transporter substrate-binding protein [Lachnospiraceae bacterium]
MKKKVLALMMATALVAGLTACGSEKKTNDTESTVGNEVTADEDTDTAEDETVYKIGVIQYVQHGALDASNEGFFAALDDAGIKYEANQQNAAGEPSSCDTIADALVNEGNDLILAIATPAAQAVAGKTTEIPIVLTAVTDPAESGLAESNDAPGGNVTGTSDLTPVKEQMELLKEVLPDTKTVGILYCSAEANSVLQADMAKEALDALGISYTDLTVSNSNEIQTVIESAVGRVDAIYTPTDNMIANGMATVAMVANENEIPVICGEEGMVNEGGLATYGIDYYELGYLAGQQAVEILVNGADPATTPIGYLAAEECELKVNEDTVAALEAAGLDLSVLKAKAQ